MLWEFVSSDTDIYQRKLAICISLIEVNSNLPIMSNVKGITDSYFTKINSIHGKKSL